MGHDSVVTQVAKESIKETSSSQAENMSCRNAKETFSTQRQLQNHQIHEIKICRFLVNIFDDVGCQGHPWLVSISSVYCNFTKVTHEDSCAESSREACVKAPWEMVHLLLRVSLQCQIFEPETHFEAENIAKIAKQKFDTSNFELIIRLTRKHVEKQVHITKQGL